MRRRRPQHFYAFDILWFDRKDLLGLPLVEPQGHLRRVVSVQPAPVLYADHFEQRGIDLFRAVSERDLEGIPAKHNDALSTAEETSWLKIKNPNYTQAEERHEFFDKRALALEPNHCVGAEGGSPHANVHAERAGLGGRGATKRSDAGTSSRWITGSWRVYRE
jgi:hypothetical protein